MCIIKKKKKKGVLYEDEESKSYQYNKFVR